ncbi:MAG: VirB4 family type IV secretion system protein [Alphaproteobacteria bacterium]
MSGIMTVLGFGGAAVIGGALAVPASRKLIRNSLEQDWLHKELEFESIQDHDTITTKKGHYAHVWQLSGLSYESRGVDEQQALSTVRAALFKDLSTLGINIRLIGRKRIKPLDLSAKWPSASLQQIGDSEAEHYKTGFEIDWFIMLSCRQYKALKDGSDLLRAMLSGLMPQQIINDDHYMALSNFVNYLICGEDAYDQLPFEKNLSKALPASDLRFKDDGLLTTQAPNAAYWRTIAIKLWPEEVGGQLMRDLLHLNYELEINQTCAHVRKTKLQWDFKRKTNQFGLMSLVSNNNIAGEYEAATDLLMEDAVSFYDTQFSILVRTNDHAQLDVAVKAITDILGRLRISYHVETKGAPVCWFNRHPGHENLLRPLRLTTDAIAALWPFPQAVKGMAASPFGEGAVRVFKTEIGAPYKFQFHNSTQNQSLGHFMVIAPSNSGKSTLIMHLLSGLARFDGIRSYIFDSKEGVRFMTEAMGGLYHPFDRLALNPLDVGEDTKQNRQRVRLVMQAMLGNIEFTPDVERQINHAVDICFTVAPPDRTFNNIFSPAFSAGESGDSVLKQAFSRWVTTIKGDKGAYADIFNAPHDSLSSLLSGRFMVGVNMNEALDDPILGPPVVAHIAQAISQSAAHNSKGFTIFIDEAAKLLQNQGFKAVASEMYREYRKLNGIVGMAFQDPSALSKSGMMEAALDNTACLFFFPNPQGRVADYANFNLRDEELSFIFGAQGLTGGRRCLLIKNDPANMTRESVILNIDLAPLGDALKFYRSGSNAVKDMIRAQEAHGANWWEEI